MPTAVDGERIDMIKVKKNKPNLPIRSQRLSKFPPALVLVPIRPVGCFSQSIRDKVCGRPFGDSINGHSHSKPREPSISENSELMTLRPVIDKGTCRHTSFQ